MDFVDDTRQRWPFIRQAHEGERICDNARPIPREIRAQNRWPALPTGFVRRDILVRLNPVGLR